MTPILTLTTLEDNGTMLYVLTLTGYRPAARTDGLPWTVATLEEAATTAGPWTLIDTFPLTPLDTDPKTPRERDFTTENATLPVGWYRVTWADATGDKQQTEPVFNGWPRPAMQDVAALLRARTAVSGGGTIGTFNATTDPTDRQVEEYIDESVSTVLTHVGLDLPESVRPMARRQVALGAALLAELGSEEINEPRYDRLKSLYDERLAQLVDAAQDAEAGGDPGGVDDRTGGFAGWATAY